MRAWERQEDESARAYEAFAVYRDMGPERSLAKVAEMVGKSTAQMEKWSRRHSWVDRTRALADRDEMIRREAIEEHLRGSAEDHARREAELRDKALEARELAMEKTLNVLRWPLAERRKVEEGPDGQQVTYLFLPSRWSLGNAVNLFQMAVGDEARGEDLEELYAETDFSDLTDEELSRYVELSEKLGVKRPER